jgi:hypothetical protein
MAAEDRVKMKNFDATYERLDDTRAKLVTRVEAWAADATTLNGDYTNADDKADVVALRATFIAGIRAALGL